MNRPHRCGYVTLIGRPNVGKSTLLNRLLGEKLAITSPRPQTTRNRIPGILNRPEAQIIFLDTPGIHRARRALNHYMVEVAQGSLWDTDMVVVMVEAGVGPDGEVGVNTLIRELLDDLKEKEKRVFLAINKIDRLSRELILPIIAAYVPWELEILPISAKTGDGVERLLSLLIEALPEGPPLYPPDSFTDLPERFIASELIREKIFRLLKEELPYSTAVTIEEWRDRHSEGRVDIKASIHVERSSQKGIVIGRGGRMIKEIGVQSRKDLERLLAAQVDLRLFVRVEKDWTRAAGSLKKLGYES